QRAREAARVAECRNRLRQIAQGMHTYHSARRKLPPGTLAKPLGQGMQCDLGMTWAIAILPQVEESDLFALYDDALSNVAPKNDALRTAAVATYTCPDDPSA